MDLKRLDTVLHTKKIFMYLHEKNKVILNKNGAPSHKSYKDKNYQAIFYVTHNRNHYKAAVIHLN